jgi:hypothetical protein
MIHGDSLRIEMILSIADYSSNEWPFAPNKPKHLDPGKPIAHHKN